MDGSRVRIETCDGVGGSPPMTARFERAAPCGGVTARLPDRAPAPAPAPLHSKALFVSCHFYYASDSSFFLCWRHRYFTADIFETTYSFTSLLCSDAPRSSKGEIDMFHENAVFYETV